METIAMQASSASATFSEARRQAIYKANEVLTEPVIIAWKDDKTSQFAPEIPGGTADRWHEYAESHDGKLELNIGDTFHFVFGEAANFEKPDLNLTSVSEKDGTTFLCLNNACTEEDKQKVGYFPGGGLGG